MVVTANEEVKWKDIVLKNFRGIYEDEFGNRLDTNNQTMDVTFKGRNNNIKIGETCKIVALKISLGNNNQIILGDGLSTTNNTFTIGNECKIMLDYKGIVRDGVKILMGNYSEMRVGMNTELRARMNVWMASHCFLSIGMDNKILLDSELTMFDNSKLLIGNKNSMFKKNLILCHSFTETVIENDSMFAAEVEIINGDGHSIFDVSTGKKINCMKTATSEKRTIKISNHVWLGQRCMVLSGSVIEEGSIVGANAVVKNHIQNNCIVAGSPAKIIKKNVAWSRNNDANEISVCNPFANLTKE